MKINIFTFLFTFLSLSTFAQFNNFKTEFASAYSYHSNIPKGLLEAISYNKTHIQNLDEVDQSCAEIPSYFGPMGIVEDGKGYFKNTADIIAELSEENIESILKNPAVNIESYAMALENLTQDSKDIYDYIAAIKTLNELPIRTQMQQYAKDSELYSILILLKRKSFMEKLGYKTINIDLKKVFGNNLKILSAKKVMINVNEIYNENGNHYKALCPDYTQALWVNSPNYNSRNGIPITDVTIHVTQGSYAGAISWFQNTTSFVSAHYVIRSSDGQITQMVCESDRGWHVGSENDYTIGIEHEGFVNDPSWFTDSMYESSADLVKDITNSGYGISPLSAYKGTFQGVVNSCYHIKGHIHFPNQTHTDPGIFWDWDKYYHLINDVMAFVIDTNCNGNFTDSGGVIGTYSSFQSYMTVISPTNADSVVLTFSSFDLELGFDTMRIYDGTDTSGMLIGSYSGTTSPGTVVGTSGSLAIVFYSDCLYNNDGWEANWNCFYSTNPILGCTDSVACNFNTNATTDDGSCAYASTSNSFANSCNTYLWNGNTYNISGTYYFTTNNSVGCDSIASLNLTINYSNSSTTTDTSCSSYLWNGVTYTQSGTYDSTFSNQLGCDSVASLNLTITGLPTASITQIGNDLEVTMADSYFWNTSETTQNITPNSNGIYWCIITDANGCISDTAFFTVSFPTYIDEANISEKTLLKITDVLGRKTKEKKNTTLFYIYKDGAVIRKLIIE
ncbi:MAG: N-acetylmuramoyl-L-alanine amidase [Flavobacteriales bacterium]|nr:N-acetylmuramoyl-L-alanine amidase [Flavobacteriales bacterium]